MFKSILRTFITRIIVAIFSILLVIITTQKLGAENYGTISLIMVSVGFSHLFSSLIGGTAIVYYASRINLSVIFSVSLVWSFIMSIAVPVVIYLIGFIPREFLLLTILSAFFSNVYQNYLNFLLGKEEILKHNLISLFQIVLFFVLLSLFFIFLNTASIEIYLFAYLFSHLASIAFLQGKYKIIKSFSFENVKEVVKNLSKYGFWVQISALIQLFNYRLIYFFVDIFLGRKILGIITLSIQLAEQLWILPRSIAMVLFSRVSASRDVSSNINLTISLLQYNIVFLLFLSAIFLFIPESVFIWVFGNSFEGIKKVFLLLLPGVIIFSITTILGHFFSGIGKVYFNTISSGLGFIVIALLGYYLTLNFKITGAAIAINLCYFTIALASMVQFVRCNNLKIKDLLIFRYSPKNILHLFLNLMKSI